MTLPLDTILALEERRQDPSAVPRSMPASFYSDPAMYPVEVDSVFLNGFQKGLHSRFATRGFLAPPDYEGTVWDFYQYLADRMLE